MSVGGGLNPVAELVPDVAGVAGTDADVVGPGPEGADDQIHRGASGRRGLDPSSGGAFQVQVCICGEIAELEAQGAGIGQGESAVVTWVVLRVHGARAGAGGREVGQVADAERRLACLSVGSGLHPVTQPVANVAGIPDTDPDVVGPGGERADNRIDGGAGEKRPLDPSSGGVFQVQVRVGREVAELEAHGPGGGQGEAVVVVGIARLLQRAFAIHGARPGAGRLETGQIAEIDRRLPGSPGGLPRNSDTEPVVAGAAAVVGGEDAGVVGSRAELAHEGIEGVTRAKRPGEVPSGRVVQVQVRIAAQAAKLERDHARIVQGESEVVDLVAGTVHRARLGARRGQVGQVAEVDRLGRRPSRQGRLARAEDGANAGDVVFLEGGRRVPEGVHDRGGHRAVAEPEGVSDLVERDSNEPLSGDGARARIVAGVETNVRTKFEPAFRPGLGLTCRAARTVDVAKAHPDVALVAVGDLPELQVRDRRPHRECLAHESELGLVERCLDSALQPLESQRRIRPGEGPAGGVLPLGREEDVRLGVVCDEGSVRISGRPRSRGAAPWGRCRNLRKRAKSGPRYGG